MTTIDRRERVERYVEFWLPAGFTAKDFSKIIQSASQEWCKVHGYQWDPKVLPECG